MKEVLIGDTVRLTWVSSGITPSDISAAIVNGSETVVGSASMISSGNGHYYADITVPNTPGFYVVETLSTINGLPYKRKTKFEAKTGEVD